MNFSPIPIYYNPKTGGYHLLQKEKALYFKPQYRNMITQKHQKYCRCLLHVKAKNPYVNPYAVCRSRIGPTGSSKCLEYMDRSNIKRLNKGDAMAYKKFKAAYYVRSKNKKR